MDGTKDSLQIVGWTKTITETRSETLFIQHIYPNHLPVLMAFIHIFYRIFGLRCEKKQQQGSMQMLSHINLCPAQSYRPDYFNLFWFTS